MFIIQTLHVPWLNTIDMTYRYLTSMKRGRHGRHWIHIYISFSDQISFECIDGSNRTRRSNYTSSYRCVDKREVCFCELFLWMPILVRFKTINKDNSYFYRNTRLSYLSCSWTPRTVRQLMKFARLSRGRTCDSLATLQTHLTAALRVNTRQSWEHRTPALRLVKINFRYVILSAICCTVWRLR